jgi:hypothetical protein
MRLFLRVRHQVSHPSHVAFFFKSVRLITLLRRRHHFLWQIFLQDLVTLVFWRTKYLQNQVKNLVTR